MPTSFFGLFLFSTALSLIATFTAGLAAGATTEEAALLANYAGGIVVMKRGTATVTQHELLAALKKDAQNVAENDLDREDD